MQLTVNVMLTYNSSEVTTPGTTETEVEEDLPITMTLQLKPNMSLYEMATQIKQQLLHRLLSLSIPGKWELMKQFYAHLQDFVFDGTTQKFQFLFKPPSDPADRLYPGSLYLTLQSIKITLTLTNEAQCSKYQHQLANAVFGGDLTQNGNFEALYETYPLTGNPSIRGQRQLLSYVTELMTQPQFDGILQGMGNMVVTSKNPCKLFLDTYIYIQGGTNATLWKPNGSMMQSVATLPRNRPQGFIQAPFNGFITSELPLIKTSVSGLKGMMLRLEDKYGNLIEFDDEYIIHFTISFEV